MTYQEKYARSLNASNLLADELHGAIDPIMAAGFADRNGDGLAALLVRVKYGDAMMHKEFEGNPNNLAALIRIWGYQVAARGAQRAWFRITSVSDEKTAQSFYKRVAAKSLEHWLDGRCKQCQGTGVMIDESGDDEESSCVCDACDGDGEAPIDAKGNELERIKDMVSELEETAGKLRGRASAYLRRE